METPAAPASRPMSFINKVDSLKARGMPMENLPSALFNFAIGLPDNKIAMAFLNKRRDSFRVRQEFIWKMQEQIRYFQDQLEKEGKVLGEEILNAAFIDNSEKDIETAMEFCAPPALFPSRRP